MNEQQKNAAKAMIELVQIMAGCIKDATELDGPAFKGIPSGHLYAMLLTLPGMTLQTYQKLEGILIESGRVMKSGDLLTWKE
jgi:hypothetical protein